MPTSVAGNRPARQVRDRNLALVLNALRMGGPASRSELAEKLRLDRSTLTHLAGSLLAAGLIVESDEEPAGSRGGRRRRPLQINPHKYAVLGVDIGLHGAAWALGRLDGSIAGQGFFERSVHEPISSSPDEGELLWIVEACQTAVRLAETSGSVPEVIFGVGISIPGLVDHQTGVLKESVSLGLHDVDIAPRVMAPGMSLLVDNDANCCLWNMADEPAGLGNSVLCQVRLHRDQFDHFKPSGAGIGIALSVDGALYYGSGGAAGELRGPGWTRESRDQLGLRLDQVERERGTDVAMRQFAQALVGNLSVVVSIMDPDRLIISGDTGILAPHLTAVFEQHLPETIASIAHREGRVEIVNPTRYPPAHGAARMVLSRILEVPLVGRMQPGAVRGWDAITARCR